jgi:hypothetical protein
MAKPRGDGQAQQDLIIDRIRSKLTDAGLRTEGDPADLAAVRAFFGDSEAAPLWITNMGLSARGQRVVF